jgi:hypothetical protein
MMSKQECRVGMVVYHRDFEVKGVVVKCNIKKAKVRIVEDIKNKRRRGVRAGSLWNMPYSSLEPVLEVKTEMAMRSFEQPDNSGIKTYFQHVAKAEELVEYPEGSPEHHVMMAVCELWRMLDDDRIRAEVEGSAFQRAAGIRNRKAQISGQINRLFSFLGREVSRETASNWEAGKTEAEKV